MEKLFYWLHMGLSYFAPSGLLLYSFVIENILSKEISTMSKIGVCGIFVMIICIVLCITLVNRGFKRKEQKYQELSIKEIDLSKREEYIKKWNKLALIHDIFKQVITLSILIVITLLVAMLESKLLALRGTLTAICIMYGSGTFCYGMHKSLKNNSKGE